jgi:hypothetical protein
MTKLLMTEHSYYLNISDMAINVLTCSLSMHFIMQTNIVHIVSLIVIASAIYLD